MNKDVFMDAVGYLDVDILAQHLQQKDRLRHKPKRKTHVWKWSAIAACLCVVFLFGILIFSNPSTPPTSNDRSLESGFVQMKFGEESDYNFCAYRSHTEKFDIHSVTLRFYYGGYYPNGIEYTLENEQSYPTFDLYFVNDEGDRYLAKHVEENFISEKYSCDIAYDDSRNIYEICYKHSEILTIPAELFTKQSGMIRFEVEGVNILEQGFENEKNLSIAEICIFYKVIDGEIVLSSQEQV